MHSLPVFAALLSSALGGSIPYEGPNGLLARAGPDNPSGNYAPASVDCPSPAPRVRPATGLSDPEKKWLQTRRPKTVEPMKKWLQDGKIPGLDAAGFMDKVANDMDNLPNIGLAVSGGGYRAMMNGAGFMSAIDSRNPGAVEGGMGGLFQSATYVAGLSGGGWLLGSIYGNNVTTIPDLQSSDVTWRLDRSIFEGPDTGKPKVLDMVNYYTEIYHAMKDKHDAGDYDVTMTDIWGRALSYQFLDANEGGPSYTWSSIQDDPHFVNGEFPMPMIMALGRKYDNPKRIDLLNTVYEMGPLETGSWDPTVKSMVPTRWIGSEFQNGTSGGGGKCVRGYDAFGFYIGTSSSIFASLVERNLSSNGVPTLAQPAVHSLLGQLTGDEDNRDAAIIKPNPFKGVNPSSNENAQQDKLIMIDGGLAEENLPFQLLIQPPRKVDVIFAADSTSNGEWNWPNGSSIRATWERSQTEMGHGVPFPRIPDAYTFFNLGLSKRPTFFGCNKTEFNGGQGPFPPLIVYIPNAPYSGWGNVSTFTMSYEDSERDEVISNGWNVATMGNGTVDKEWPICVRCAALSRSLDRTHTPIPPACTKCFQRYCYNGTTDNKQSDYQPTKILNDDGTLATAGSASNGTYTGTSSSSSTASSTASSASATATDDGDGDGSDGDDDSS